LPDDLRRPMRNVREKPPRTWDDMIASIDENLARIRDLLGLTERPRLTLIQGGGETAAAHGAETFRKLPCVKSDELLVRLGGDPVA